MVEDSSKHNLGVDISPASFFSQKDPAWASMRDGHYDYHGMELLGKSDF